MSITASPPHNQPNFTDTQSCTDFFQQRLQHLLTYWRDHEAVAELQIAVLDRERSVILKVISLGLDIKSLWCIARPLIINLTPYMERRGHWEEWHTILERAIAVAQQKGDQDHEVTLTSLLARLCQRMSRPQEVVKHYSRVIRLARRIGNRFEEARACSNLGYLYIDGGRWWRSEVLSKHALALFEELDNDHGRAHTHNHLGLLYTRKRQFDLAGEHLKIACLIWRSMEDDHGLLRGLLNQGLLYLDIENPTDALLALSEALRLAEETGDRIEIGTIHNNVGLAQIQTGDYTKAWRSLMAAKEIFVSIQDPQMLARVFQNMGRVYHYENEWHNALEMYEFALETIRLTNNREAEINIRLSLAEYAIARMNDELASTQLREIRHLAELNTTGTIRLFYQEQIDALNTRIMEL